MLNKYTRQTLLVKLESVKWFRDFEKRTVDSAILIERPESSDREIIEIEFIGGDKGCRV